MSHVIYKLTSPSGKFYIGRTKNFQDRMTQHKHEALVRRTKGALYNAIRRYGWENFIKEIVTEVPDEQTAQLVEESLIKTFDLVRKGYNQVYVGGGGNLWVGKEDQLPEFRKKMSDITRGEKNGMYGKHHSLDAIQKQKQKAKGRFSLQWYIDRYGEEEGTNLYKNRCENIRQKRLNAKTG